MTSLLTAIGMVPGESPDGIFHWGVVPVLAFAWMVIRSRVMS